jgi:hypothetical protein
MYSYLSVGTTSLSNIDVRAPFVAFRTTLSPSAFCSSHRLGENNGHVTQERNRKHDLVNSSIKRESLNKDEEYYKEIKEV